LRRLLILGASSAAKNAGRDGSRASLARRHAGQEAAHAGHRGAGQQDGEDRLGADGARRILQSSGRGGVTPTRSEAVRGREGQTRRMAQWSEDGVGKTREMSERLERAIAVWTRSAISIQASGHVTGRIKQAGHTEAPEPAHQRFSKNLLLKPGVHTRTFEQLGGEGFELEPLPRRSPEPARRSRASTLPEPRRSMAARRSRGPVAPAGSCWCPNRCRR